MKKTLNIIKDILTKSVYSLCAALGGLAGAMVCVWGVLWASEWIGVSHRTVSLTLLCGALVAGICCTAWDRRTK